MLNRARTRKGARSGDRAPSRFRACAGRGFRRCADDHGHSSGGQIGHSKRTPVPRNGATKFESRKDVDWMSTLLSAMTVYVSENPSREYCTKGQCRFQETGLAELFVIGVGHPGRFIDVGVIWRARMFGQHRYFGRRSQQRGP